MPTRRTYCRICEATCGLLLEVDDQGRPTGLSPDPDHPVSAGFACKKGLSFLEVATHPSRLLHPSRRTRGGELERVSWRAALREIGASVRSIVERHGPDAVGLYYGNPIGFTALGSLAMQRFARALGTRNVFGAGSVDCNNKFAGSELLHGSPIIHPVPDLENAELAVLFGTNPAVSMSSFVHLPGGTRALDAMKRRGARIVWVDPRRTESARRWGEHLPIRPGTDVFLLLGLLQHFAGRAPARDDRIEGLERLLALARRFHLDRVAALTGVPLEQLHALAEAIGASRATTFHMSVGVNMGGFGTLAYVTMHALAYVTGNLDRKGGLVFSPTGVTMASLAQRAGVATEPRTSRIGGFQGVLDTLPAGILADEILTPGTERIRALFVVAGDPLMAVPGSGRLREAFSGLELLVTTDMFESETGRLAHFLLPAASWLERWDAATISLPMLAEGLVQTSPPVLPLPGEVRTDARIFGDLLAAMGKDRLLAAGLRLPLDRLLPAPGYGIRVPRPRPGTYLGRGPRTPGNRLRLWSMSLEVEAVRLEAFAALLAREGFVIVGRRTKLAHNSWLKGGARRATEPPVASMAAEDLAALGLPEGGPVELRTEVGMLAIHAAPEAGLMRGVVVVPHGHPDLNVNAVLPSGPPALEPASGQHQMTAVPVTVRAAARVDAPQEKISQRPRTAGRRAL